MESYSITNEAGFVPQDEKFENGGTMREADKRMYYIVTPNSFAYNPARINVGSIGYQNTPKNVIVSSLYEVFKTTDDVNDRLLWHWFKSPDFRKLIEQLQGSRSIPRRVLVRESQNHPLRQADNPGYFLRSHR